MEIVVQDFVPSLMSLATPQVGRNQIKRGFMTTEMKSLCLKTEKCCLHQNEAILKNVVNLTSSKGTMPAKMVVMPSKQVLY